MANERAMHEKDMAEDAPLAAKQKEQATAVPAQAQTMLPYPRIMRLVQFAQEKDCH
jgi:hypothetical protein